MATHVVPIKEVIHPKSHDGWRLCFHWARYMHEDGLIEHGYRFMWRRPDNSLQPARGQARIPSLEQARELMRMAEDQGWGENAGEGA